MFYCILFCSLWLLSLGGLLFFERRQRENGTGKERRWVVAETDEIVFQIYCMREESVFKEKKRVKSIL